jgi:hypothetical protein
MTTGLSVIGVELECRAQLDDHVFRSTPRADARAVIGREWRPTSRTKGSVDARHRTANVAGIRSTRKLLGDESLVGLERLRALNG